MLFLLLLLICIYSLYMKVDNNSLIAVESLPHNIQNYGSTMSIK